MYLKDKVFDPLLVTHLNDFILKSKMNLQCSDEGDGSQFLQTNFSLEDPLIQYIAIKIFNSFDEKIKSKRIIRAYANIQFAGMNGCYHIDDGDFTGLLMVSKTLDKGDGCFVTEKESVDFVSNRVIVFNAKEKHKGNAPKDNSKGPRITLAFKTTNGD
tara:strand:- start:203 stop:676 length:474 start_codon:yes stop_codon:yes gene_type:complete